MNFQLPPDLAGAAIRELQRASIAGGQDMMPYPTEVEVGQGLLTIRRGVDESGFLQTPWPVNGLGQFMISSATLMERGQPYQLPLELARGKVNQVRSQAADWIMGGLQVSQALQEELHQVSLSFGKAVVQTFSQPDAPSPQGVHGDGGQGSQAALMRGCRAGDQLVQAYVRQVFDIRHQRQSPLETFLGCRLNSPIPQANLGLALRQTCNALTIPFPWDQIEPAESDYSWQPFDDLVEWALDQGYMVIGGPLLDFSGASLPAWLWRRERDLPALAGYLCDYVETVVKRFRTRIRTWHLAAGVNLSLNRTTSDEELLWLCVRLAEAARNVEPRIDLVIGLAQPWGDYLASQEHTHSPFLFADTLIRTGLKLSALDLEILAGVWPRGSYCRDLLDFSRILDLYALLGVPLQVTLGYPSSNEPDPRAEAGQQVNAGHWRQGINPAMQADWAASFGELAVCKPYVKGVSWIHCSDAEPHLVPHGGLVDAKGQPKPALPRWQEIRHKHLK